MKNSDELIRQAVGSALSLVAAAARTAPKTRGIDNIVILGVDDPPTVGKVAAAMREIGAREKRPSMERDAVSLEGVGALFLIGVKANPAGLDCGFCGYATCEELRKTAGICSYNSIDLGIAVGSAVSAACRLHVDTRVMYSIGKAALHLALFKDAAVRQALGIPLCATGKNPFFDRK